MVRNPGSIDLSSTLTRCTTLCVLVLALHISCGTGPNPPIRPEFDLLEFLAEGLDGVRPYEVRFSGGFSHQPCESTQLPPTLTCRAMRESEGEPRGRARELRTELSRRGWLEARTAESLHAQAVLSLFLSSDRMSLDAAIQNLLEAASLDRSSSGVLNDLGAAYYLRALGHDRPGDMVWALEYLERALELSPDFEEAGFNRGLALERLHLLDDATDSWAAFGMQWPDSAWTQEASSYHARLGHAMREASGFVAGPESSHKDLERLVRKEPQRARLLAERTLFGRWARAVMRDDTTGAARALAAARRIGTGLESHHRDAMVVSAVEAIDHAPPGDGTRQLLVLGHKAFEEGMQLYDGFDFIPARATLLESARYLREGGSPFEGWASFYATVCLYYVPDFPGVLSELQLLRDRASSDDYPNLRARIAWVEGLSFLITGMLDRSMSSYEEALGLFESTGESPYVAYLHTLIAKNQRFSGEGRRSWGHHLKALQGRFLLTDKARAFTILLSAAEQAEEDGALLVAQRLMNGQIRTAEEIGRPYVTAQAYLRRARLNTKLGRTDDAQRDVETTRGRISEIPDPGNRTRAQADLLITRALSIVDSSPAAAALLVDEARSFFQSGDNRIYELATYPILAEASVAAGDVKRASKILEGGIQLVEELREEFRGPIEKATFLESARSIYDAMIELQVEGFGDDATALAFADRSRNRWFQESVSNASLLSVSELASDLRAATADSYTLIAYRVTDGRVYGWRGTRSGLERLPIEATPAEIRELAASLRDELAEGTRQEDIRRIAARLGELLLPFPAATTSTRVPLAIAMDRELEGIPFAGLIHPETNRYLVEDWALTSLPSLASLVAVWERETLEAPTLDRRALIVANPTLDRSTFPRLPTLSRASDEARAIAALYPSVTKLAGELAIKSVFVEDLPRSEVVHFAGHALADPSGGRSGLVFSGAGESTALLTSEEIRDKDLQEVELVVLSACSTSLGYYSDSEELSSLTGAFLAAGARTVVSTLWPIDDEVARRFAIALHEAFAAGRSATEALRTTQLSMLRSEDTRWSNPATWSAFQLAGLESPAKPTPARRGAK